MTETAEHNILGVSQNERHQIQIVTSELSCHSNAPTHIIQDRRANIIVYVAEISEDSTANLFFYKDLIIDFIDSYVHRNLDALIRLRKNGNKEPGSDCAKIKSEDGSITCSLKDEE